MANSLVLTGIVVTDVIEHSTKSGIKYLSFRVKNETLKGNLREVVHTRVNVYSVLQRRLIKKKGLRSGDRVWVFGELMSRITDESGQDLLEIRGHQVDPVVSINGIQDDGEEETNGR